MSFDEIYLNTEMQYFDSVISAVKPNKLSTILEKFVAVPYWNKKLKAKSLKSSQILRAHIPYFCRPGHNYGLFNIVTNNYNQIRTVVTIYTLCNRCYNSGADKSYGFVIKAPNLVWRYFT